MILNNFEKARSVCRLCSSNTLQMVHNFGNMPLANELVSQRDERVEEFPLRFYVCLFCGLGQVDDVALPARIFGDYRYLSSASKTFLNHARNYVDFSIDQKLITNDSWVLEIASNDGYLLNYFMQMGIRTLGIEPASNVALLSQQKGIPTINRFFSSELAKQLKSEFGFPKLIVANNVLAHVPNLLDFAEGLSILCGPDTIVSVENPSALGILNGNQFDTIYHEHFSYLSVTSMEKLASMVGLEVTSVQILTIHGGSNRYFLSRKANPIKIKNNSLVSERKKEMASGLKNSSSWKGVSKRIQSTIDAFSNFLSDQGSPILGYGAAAKASTLLNSTAVSKERICAIVDLSPEKQSRFIPRDNLPIVTPNQISDFEFSEILIFPWNIVSEVREILGKFGLGHLKTHTFIPRHVMD